MVRPEIKTCQSQVFRNLLDKSLPFSKSHSVQNAKPFLYRFLGSIRYVPCPLDMPYSSQFLGTKMQKSIGFRNENIHKKYSLRKSVVGITSITLSHFSVSFSNISRSLLSFSNNRCTRPWLFHWETASTSTIPMTAKIKQSSDFLPLILLPDCLEINFVSDSGSDRIGFTRYFQIFLKS